MSTTETIQEKRARLAAVEAERTKLQGEIAAMEADPGSLPPGELVAKEIERNHARATQPNPLRPTR